MIKRKLALVILLFLTAGSFLISGCTGATVGVGEQPHYRHSPAKAGPPPWAPAHGLRARYTYQYYPSWQIYYDLNRNLYFYSSGGQWKTSHRSPVRIHSRTRDSVILYMMTDRPYQYHPHVMKHYPPGQARSTGRGRR
jgi:predicted small secreted protein